MVDVGAAFPSDGQATELVEQGEGLFDDPASRGDLVAGSSSWDVAGDASLPQFLVDAGVVVALVRDWAPIGGPPIMRVAVVSRTRWCCRASDFVAGPVCCGFDL